MIVPSKAVDSVHPTQYNSTSPFKTPEEPNICLNRNFGWPPNVIDNAIIDWYLWYCFYAIPIYRQQRCSDNRDSERRST